MPKVELSKYYKPYLEGIIEEISQTGLLTIKFEEPIKNTFKNYTLNNSLLYLCVYNLETNYFEELNYAFKDLNDESLVFNEFQTLDKFVNFVFF